MIFVRRTIILASFLAGCSAQIDIHGPSGPLGDAASMETGTQDATMDGRNDAGADSAGGDGLAPSCFASATLHVSTTGDDANEGRAARPFKTIAKALTIATPGDTVCVRAGVYRERVSFPKSGSAGAPITLAGEAGTIIDGGERFPNGWTLATDVDPNTTTIWKKTLPYAPRTMTWNGKWTFNYSRAARANVFTWMKDGQTGSNSYDITKNPYTSFNGIEAFFAVFDGTTYVRLPAGKSPASEDLAFAPSEYSGGAGITIDGKSYVTVRGLTVTNTMPVYLGHAPTHTVVENNTLVGGRFTITMAGDGQANDVVIRNNDVSLNYIHSTSPDDPIHWFIWRAEKRTGDNDHTGIVLYCAGNTQVYGNRVHGHWDGIAEYCDSTQAAGGLDVHDNIIEDLMDDGLEAGFGGVKASWHDNVVSRANIAIRIANPTLNQGPVYVYRNKVFASEQTQTGENLGIYYFKGNVPATAFVYHNSISAATCVHFGGTDSSIGQPQSRVVNNVFSCAKGFGNNWGANTPLVDYNWFGGVPNLPAQSWVGTHNVLKPGERMWAPNTLPSFTVGSSAKDAGFDVNVANASLGTPYLGFGSGAYKGSAPDLGAVQVP